MPGGAPLGSLGMCLTVWWTPLWQALMLLLLSSPTVWMPMHGVRVPHWWTLSWLFGIGGLSMRRRNDYHRGYLWMLEWFVCPVAKLMSWWWAGGVSPFDSWGSMEVLPALCMACGLGSAGMHSAASMPLGGCVAFTPGLWWWWVSSRWRGGPWKGMGICCIPGLRPSWACSTLSMSWGSLCSAMKASPH